ncbi:Na+/H+ antiporter subunit D [Mariniluteicoccus endophyticus]
MTLSSMLVPLPVVLPLVGAGLTLVLSRRDLWQRVVTLAVLGGVLAASLGLLALSDIQGPLVVEVGGWHAPTGIVLVVDRLAALMLVVSTTVTLGVTMYAIGQGASSDDERDGEAPLPIFHPTLMVLLAGVSTTFVSGDLFHIYVGFEMLLVASFVLLTLGGSSDRVRAGVNYVFVSLLSSMFFLAAIAFIYTATGTVNLAQLAVRLDGLPPGTQLTLQLLLLLGFAVKAAVFPMSGWLPDSYPTAPAPVTAVFAGLLTKVGVYAIIRTETLLFPHGRLDPILLVAAALTMLAGILGAIAQDDIKRLLSFTLVSHIGYLLFGVAVGNTIGLSGAIFYVAHHILIQTTLFLVVGLVQWRRGTTSLTELGGLARTAPMVAVLFFLPAINLAGIPPFSGFLGKVALMQGGVRAGTPMAYALVAASALTSLLTLYAVARVWARAFWSKPVAELTESDLDPARLRELQRHGERRIPRGMLVPTMVLVAVGIALSVVAGPLYAITERSAAELRNRDTYIGAVFPGGIE